MSVLKVSGPVRRAIGANAAALAAGIGLPADAQCWQCGEVINLFAARPGSVTLSAVLPAAMISVPTFGHAEHTTSRVFTAAEFAAAASTKASPLAGGGEPALLIDGRQADNIRVVDDGDGGAAVVVDLGDPPPVDAGSEIGDGGEILADPGLRQRLLDLAAEVDAAGSDERALQIMRWATGLSMTDPDADAAELAARAARARLAQSNRDRGALVLTVRCPSCGQLPDLVLNPGQAFCGNDDCEALQFAPDLDPFEQLANRTQAGPLVGPGAIPAETAAAAAAARPVQVRGSATDDAREAQIRDLFHRWGYVCADRNGSCGVCGWAGDWAGR